MQNSGGIKLEPQNKKNSLVCLLELKSENGENCATTRKRIWRKNWEYPKKVILSWKMVR